MNPILISKYLAGECTPEERQELELWVHADEGNASCFEQCRKSWEAAQHTNEEETAQAWLKLQTRIQNLPVASPKTKTTKLTKWFARVAAVLIPIVMITWYIANDRYVQLAEVRTGKGERKPIILADGTRVWLNSESSLKYPLQFEDNAKREVYLSGEAYFRVSADSNNLFVVNTGNVAAKAYGTSFNVCGYPEQGAVKVALDEGKLAVEAGNNQEELTIHPGQLAIIDKEAQKIALDSIRTDHNLWIENKIVFEDETLSQVLLTLERWYNTRIILSPENTGNCRFSGSFSNQKLEDVLIILKEALNLRIENKNNTFYISAQGC